MIGFYTLYKGFYKLQLKLYRFGLSFINKFIEKAILKY